MSEPSGSLDNQTLTLFVLLIPAVFGFLDHLTNSSPVTRALCCGFLLWPQ